MNEDQIRAIVREEMKATVSGLQDQVGAAAVQAKMAASKADIAMNMAEIATERFTGDRANRPRF